MLSLFIAWPGPGWPSCRGPPHRPRLGLGYAVGPTGPRLPAGGRPLLAPAHIALVNWKMWSVSLLSSIMTLLFTKQTICD